ncbi:hypothetical protein [Hymenobacter psychrotolerans]|uniref:Uncharacterized protein n=1 Tax=Hymenobacter psychrotolerans DSM 18569 TaxID=1121959 RepID=A0A1M6UMT0_9BACT|nr:hypothetical protein [Hymenobacter psychrotolerans]SHK70524.1 hypothetical protein SAMN02746009_01416 [Hymenobacter psychrotolerans DSM 18569]
MYRILILLFALLMISGGETAEAARPSAYARAKMSGRMFTHRPNYKLYKGRKKKKLFHFGKTSRSKAKYSSKRSSRF